ncbi:MAG: asparagine synthase (glutamine-hydrolyzing) [Dehalococcoidia bacterium]|tara:strand:- start:2906 stop:4747 length:1842 start_codon:yes stop_codon:yes gene_type:complete
MCGISGITNENVNIVENMTDITCHRGPDDRGIYSENNVTLGHSRLSIQDLTRAGHQPMVSSTGRYVIVYNGEIYNFKRLREGISGSNKLKSISDTEVILELFEKYGIESIKKLSGIYAFAIWDKKEKRLILSRDKVGVKPLYYSIQNNNLIFCSELKGIFKHSSSRKINLNALNCYFKFGYVTGEQTIWEDIYKLLPGQIIIFKNNKIEKIDYKKEVEIPEIKSKNDAKKVIPEILTSVVKDQMISDVPVGLFLSGGIDSNLLLSLMSDVSDYKINTYSSFFKVEEKDDLKFNSDARIAKKSADFFGSNHFEVKIDEKSIIENIESAIWHMDEPNSNSSLIPNYLLAKDACKTNKVVLSGEGGDEIFGGYDRYKSIRIIDKFSKIPKILRDTSLKIIPKNIVSKKNKFRLGEASTFDIYMSFAENNEKHSNEIYKLDHQDSYLRNYISQFFDKPDLLSSIVNAEMNSWMLDDYLMRADKMCMAFGLENRVPFLDERLVALSNKLDSSWKYPLQSKNLGKKILIDSISDKIPEFVLGRKKRGWVTPISKWLREGLRDMSCDIANKNYVSGTDEFINFDNVNLALEDHYNYRNYGVQTVWNIITFQIWYKKFMGN